MDSRAEAFKDAVAAYYENGVVQDAISHMVRLGDDSCNLVDEQKEVTTKEHEITPNPELSPLNSHLSISTDGYGREILVEEFASNGKPRVWYQTDTEGKRYRKERKGFGVFSELVEKITL